MVYSYNQAWGACPDQHPETKKIENINMEMKPILLKNYNYKTYFVY
jgi:hypothetical protein